MELLLETVFSIWFMQSGYKEDNWGTTVSWVLKSPPVENEIVARVQQWKEDFMCTVFTVGLL
jgi:hypothetical protein